MTAAETDPVRWGILSTARIGVTSFLPGLIAAGGGQATLVAGRDLRRTQEFAATHGVARAAEGYRRVLDDDDVEAVYIPLPNSLHAKWTVEALRAGKAVLCEKPMCPTLEETHEVLQEARRSPKPLWEAFVFRFHRQTERLLDLLADGAIGAVREVRSSFHFVARAGDIRLSAELAGGSLADVGCYPVQLARAVFGAEAVGVRASVELTESGVDAEAWGIVDFPGGRRLLMSSGFRSPRASSAVIVGTEGEVRLDAPFGATLDDTVTICRAGAEPVVERWGTGHSTFTEMLQHIHRVLRGEEAPRRLAVDDAAGNAAVLDAIRRSAARPSEPVARAKSN
jgi:predicted dehydrogenase